MNFVKHKSEFNEEGFALKTFSEKIRDKRKELGLSQEELGNRIGVSKRMIIKYENDGVKPRQAVMKKLAEVLNISVEYLSLDDNENDNNTVEKKVEELLEKNTALFAGGELSQEAKDSYFEALMKAYLTCKEQAQNDKISN